MRIGLVIAMAREFELLLPGLTDVGTRQEGHFTFGWGHLGAHEAALICCGIGKVFASLGTSALAHHARPDCIISVGCAGGLFEGCQVGDITVGSQAGYYDVWCGEPNALGQVQGAPTAYQCNPFLRDALSKGLASQQVGTAACGELFIPNANELRRIKELYPDRVSVDMESGAVGQTCWLLNYPFAVIRAISDTPGAVEDSGQQYKEFWEKGAKPTFEQVLTRIKEIENPK